MVLLLLKMKMLLLICRKDEQKIKKNFVADLKENK